MEEILNKSLDEGKYYDFKIEGKTRLSVSDDFFLVLRDQSGTKHLLDLKPFKNYNFEESSNITCRVDHISCSGKIYLEPPHPFYELGERYSFKVAGFKDCIDERGFVQAGILLTDSFNSTFVLPCGKNYIPFSIDDIIDCEVFAIKKAQVFLSHHKLYPVNNLRMDMEHRLLYERTEWLNSKEFLIYSDYFGIFYSLQKEHYKFYNIENKPEIICNFIKFSAGGYFVVEPLHPEYKVGNTYTFTKRRSSFVFGPNGEKLEVVYTLDVFDNEVAIPLNETINWEGNTFQYKIQRIRKGQIYTAY